MVKLWKNKKENMKLTKQQAIEGHRKMWNWIADKIEREKRICDISYLKLVYCITNNLFLINNCFCCEYSSDDDYSCKKCPIDWIKTKHCSDSEKSLYKLVLCAYTWRKQVELARMIANLPERVDTEENEG